MAVMPIVSLVRTFTRAAVLLSVNFAIRSIYKLNFNRKQDSLKIIRLKRENTLMTIKPGYLYSGNMDLVLEPNSANNEDPMLSYEL